MMNVLNFAHAAMYMLGAYFSYSLLQATDQFWLSLMVCPILLFVIGALIERFLLRRVHVYGHLHELLLTFGLAYIITEVVKWAWGNFPLAVNIGASWATPSRSSASLPRLPDIHLRLRRLRGDHDGPDSLQDPSRDHPPGGRQRQ